MRTGNAWVDVTFRTPQQPEARVTLLDAGEDAVAEIAIPSVPWEESASVPVEAMSAFRNAVEDLPERWDHGPKEGEGLVVRVAFEFAGQPAGFEGRWARPVDLPEPQRRLFAALAAAMGAALVGGRSRRALDVLASWAR